MEVIVPLLGVAASAITKFLPWEKLIKKRPKHDISELGYYTPKQAAYVHTLKDWKKVVIRKNGIKYVWH